MSSRTSELREEIDQIVDVIGKSDSALASALIGALEVVYKDSDTDDERLDYIRDVLQRRTVLDLLIEG